MQGVLAVISLSGHSDRNLLWDDLQPDSFRRLTVVQETKVTGVWSHVRWNVAWRNNHPDCC